MIDKGLRQPSCDRSDRGSAARHADKPRGNSTHIGGGGGEFARMEKHWYAFKVYYNRIQPLLDDCRELGLEFFAPVDVIKSLLFLHCNETEMALFQVNHRTQAWVYYNSERTHAAVIPDREMEVFRFVVTAGRAGLELLGDDRPEYHEGDRVVVTGGPFKGAEGHIKRIKRDRRLVVTIRGVVAVATTYIHPSLLRRVDESVSL